MLKNKRGWIRIVEAFVAILIVFGVVVFMFNQGYLGNDDISEEVGQIQINILRNIELNYQNRNAILTANTSAQTSSTNCEKPLPIYWDGNCFPTDVKDKIENYFQDYPYLECQAVICELNAICSLETIPQEAQDQNIYAKSVAIAATTQTYSPRQLKLFCWEK